MSPDAVFVVSVKEKKERSTLNILLTWSGSLEFQNLVAHLKELAEHVM